MLPSSIDTHFCLWLVETGRYSPVLALEWPVNHERLVRFLNLKIAIRHLRGRPLVPLTRKEVAGPKKRPVPVRVVRADCCS